MSGTLGFRYFPARTWRPSGVNIEFDASQANTAVQAQRALLIGQKLAAGTAVADMPVQAYSQNQVNGLCGAASMAALAYAKFRRQNPFGEVWLGVLADNGAGVTATGTITITGTATAAGSLALYVADTSIPVPVATGDTPTVMAAAVAAAIILAGLPVTPVASVGVVTMTALHKGLALNDFDLRLNYIGAQNGEATPAGVTVAFSNPVSGSAAGTMAGGTTNPVLTTLLANLGEQLFDFIACPYNDSVSLDAMRDFMSDQSGRWSAIFEQYGHVFYAFRGTMAQRGTFGATRNDQHATCIGYFDSPTPTWLMAADWAAAHAIRLAVNPAQGLTGQQLGLSAPPLAARDDPGERNTLLHDGISTYKVDPAGVCRIDRSITTYQTNPSGQPDDSYLATNLLFQAMFAARYIIAQLDTQYVSAGKILVADGTPIGPGSPATTPSDILGATNAIYAYLCTQFVCQNPQTFARNATAGPGSKGQVVMYLPLDFSDQVINIAILAQFRQTT